MKNKSMDNPVEHVSPQKMRNYEHSWASDRQREAEKLGRSTVKPEHPVMFILAAIGLMLILAVCLGLFFL